MYPDPSSLRTPAGRRAAWASFGVRAFSWIAGLSLALAAALLFRPPAAPGAVSIGLLAGIALLVAGNLPFVRRYAFPANALCGGGIAVLYATMYALLVGGANVWLALIGMMAVSAVAIFLADRYDSLTIALVGVIGGFLVPALVSIDTIPLFSYLLFLNAVIAWLTSRKPWMLLLLAIAIVATALYEWAWVFNLFIGGTEFLTVSTLPMAAVIFAVLALVGSSPLWWRDEAHRPLRFRRIASMAALLPLLFALYVASEVDLGAQYNVLFGFLFVIALMLMLIAWRTGPGWLHAVGGIAVLATFAIWFARSYTHAAWPWILVWLALFIVLYMVRTTLFAPLLFFAFICLAMREPQGNLVMIVAMLLLLAYVLYTLIRRGTPLIGAIAIALSSGALVAYNVVRATTSQIPIKFIAPPPLWLLVIAHGLLFAALFVVAWKSGRPVLAILAIPFYAAMLATAYWPGTPPLIQVLVAAVPWVLFVAYAYFMRDALLPWIAAALASLLFVMAAWAALAGTAYGWGIGVVSLIVAAVMAVMFWKTRVTLVGHAALVFLNLGLLLLLPQQWLLIALAIESAALAWLFLRFPHRAVLVWSLALAAVVFVCLAFNGNLSDRWWVYLACAGAMFAAAWFVRRTPWLEVTYSLAGLIESFFLVNILIANWFHSTGTPINIEFRPATELEVLVYTIAWAGIATSLLIVGYLFGWRGARVGALSLLIATIAKCFLHDVWRLTGNYRVISLFVLAISLVLVGIALQKFVVNRTPAVQPV